MSNKKGGYVIVDLTSTNLYAKLQESITLQKPILLVDGVHTPFYATTIEQGANTITINGQYIVNSDNTTSGGFDFSALKYLTYDADDDDIKATKGVVEIMEGYSFTEGSKANITISTIYASAVKNGNKLTLVTFASLTRTGSVDGGFVSIGSFVVPDEIMDKLYPYSIGDSAVALDYRTLNAYKKTNASSQALNFYVEKTLTTVDLTFTGINSLDANDEYVVRIEETFLLSDNMVNNE